MVNHRHKGTLPLFHQHDIAGSRWEISIDGSRLWWLQGPIWTFRCQKQGSHPGGMEGFKTNWNGFVWKYRKAVTPTWFIIGTNPMDFLINISLVNSWGLRLNPPKMKMIDLLSHHLNFWMDGWTYKTTSWISLWTVQHYGKLIHAEMEWELVPPVSPPLKLVNPW